MNSHFTISSIAQDLLNTSITSIALTIEKLSNHISLEVFLTDQHYQILALSSPSGVSEFTIMAIQQLSASASTPAFQCKIMTLESDKYGFATPITHGNELLGYLFFIQNGESYRLEEYESLLAYTASLFSIKLYQNRELRKEKMKFKEVFLFDILYGNFKQKEEILEYGHIWGWNFAVPNTVAVFSIADFNHISTDQHIINTLLYIAERTLLERNMKPISLKRQNHLVIIFPSEETEQKKHLAQIEDFSGTVLRLLSTQYPERSFSCGIGKTYRNPADLFRSYQEAKVALDLGEIMGIDISFFTDLGLERILYKHDLQDLKEFYTATLGGLQEYDNTNNVDLMNTLESLVTNQFDITATSKALFLHRNTLRYRMKKMEEILDMKLDDLNTKLNILAAFKVKMLRKL
ncbi:PucR family transcriptional regulator [Neobacillus muris]|uniref:PucR family transcriptional regulator n=1 Tax=Neobacillus muris TaxID=2941334 RepID=UPI0020424719|nr:helix-turn-helix domain-containing protein [Neobacillus muris]